MKGILEVDLREPVADHLRALGCEVYFEVPILHRHADVVGIQGEEVVAVELKLTQWRVALAQARAYQLGAQRAYLALPQPRAEALRRAPSPLESEGVGLLGVALPVGKVRELLPATPSPRYLPFVAERVIQVARTMEGPSVFLPSMASFLADLWEASA